MTARFAIDLQRIAIAQLLRIHGVDRISGTAHDVVVDVTSFHIELLARSVQEAAAQDRRTSACLMDLIQGCDDAEVNIFELRDYIKEWKQQNDRAMERRLKAVAVAAARAATSVNATASITPALVESLPVESAVKKDTHITQGLVDNPVVLNGLNNTLASRNIATLGEGENTTAQQQLEDKGPPALGFPRMAPGPFPLDPYKMFEDPASQVNSDEHDMDIDDSSDIGSNFNVKPVDLFPPCLTDHNFALALSRTEAEVPSWGNDIDNIMMDLDDDHGVDGDEGRGKTANPYLYPVSFLESKLSKSGRQVTRFSQQSIKLAQTKPTKSNPVKRSIELLSHIVKGLHIWKPPNSVISNRDMVQYLGRRQIVGISSFRDSMLPYTRSLMDDLFLMMLPNMFTVLGCEKIPDEIHILPPIEEMHDVRTRHEMHSKKVETSTASTVSAPIATSHTLPSASHPPVKLKTVLTMMPTPAPVSTPTSKPIFVKSSASTIATTPTPVSIPSTQHIRLSLSSLTKPITTSTEKHSASAISASESTSITPYTETATPSVSNPQIRKISFKPTQTPVFSNPSETAPVTTLASATHASIAKIPFVAAMPSSETLTKTEVAQPIARPTIKLKPFALSSKPQPQTSASKSPQPIAAGVSISKPAEIVPATTASTFSSAIQPLSEPKSKSNTSPHKLKLKFSIATPKPSSSATAATSTPSAVSSHASSHAITNSALLTPSMIPSHPISNGEHDDDEEVINCICSIPTIDDGTFMIACDICSHWFHGRCVNVYAEVSQWRCPRHPE
ncbi:hypothetical protein O5D80_000141 [Batrachochytrium dendrobatidis]|nr:hypothetical protein O5D80_000141 [Batrachochytrium dendrobatidis]